MRLFLPGNIFLDHIKALPHRAVETAWGPQGILTPLLQVRILFPKLLGGIGFYRLHNLARGYAGRVLDKKMDVVLRDGHFNDIDLQVPAGLPDDALAGDGDPALQNFSAELRSKD